MAFESASSHKRTLALPKEAEHWSLTTLREKLVKIGAKFVRHGRYIVFQSIISIPLDSRYITGKRPAPTVLRHYHAPLQPF